MAEVQRPWSAPQIFWSAAIAIVVWSAIGFSWFGAGFNWRTAGGASQATHEALVENLASICVSQATGAADASTKLAELANMSSWKRRDFIESANWATMPGSDAPYRGVSTLCAEKLALL